MVRQLANQISHPSLAVVELIKNAYDADASEVLVNLENAMQTIRRIKAGRCWINSVIDGTAELPIGGYKKSGLGRELGRYGFDEYSQFKGVHVTFGKPPAWFGG